MVTKMPIYCYECARCKKKYTVKHSASEEIEWMFQVRERLFFEKDLCDCESAVDVVIKPPTSQASLSEQNRHVAENIVRETREELDVYKDSIRQDRELSYE